MSCKLFVAAVFLAAVVPCEAYSQTSDPSEDDYQIVWADEFNVDGPPDPKNWAFERGFVRNDELQWYQKDNARCENGNLVIEARREQIKNPRYDSDARDWRRRVPGFWQE